MFSRTRVNLTYMFCDVSLIESLCKPNIFVFLHLNLVWKFGASKINLTTPTLNPLWTIVLQLYSSISCVLWGIVARCGCRFFPVLSFFFFFFFCLLVLFGWSCLELWSPRWGRGSWLLCMSWFVKCALSVLVTVLFLLMQEAGCNWCCQNLYPNPIAI